MPTLGKAERLYRQRSVSALFARGRRIRISGGAYMLKVCALLCDPTAFDESSEPVKAMFSAPKSSFRHAVDRNRMKRLMREGFRARKAVWTALASAEPTGDPAALAESAAVSASADPTAAEPTAAEPTSGGRQTLFVAFIFTKIGKTPEGFVLKQADMQGYMDRAADKLGRILANEGGLGKC